MSKVKSAYTDQKVCDFLDKLDSEQQKSDSLELINLFSSISGFEPKMYGSSIIGFGNYHYKYDSGHQGDAPLLGFSPRKTAISLYVFTGLEEHEYLLKDLGKYKIGKACIYVKKNSDINFDTLKTLCKQTIQFLQEKYK